jgi:hypothetical protein
MGVAALIDTNVLVYRFDGRFPDKQGRATQLLRDGVNQGSCRPGNYHNTGEPQRGGRRWGSRTEPR